MVIGDPSFSRLSALLPSSDLHPQNYLMLQGQLKQLQTVEGQRMHLTTESASLSCHSKSTYHTIIPFIWARTPMGTACRHVGLGNAVLQKAIELPPHKIEFQTLRHKKNAYRVASHCLPQQGENELAHSLSYAFPNHIGKRRKSSPKPLVLSEARKQLMIYRLPQVLRLHLKRFR